MDVKDLNKSQLILLTLLVSFVTSIATGIATVTLLQEVPAPVSQTINRVVQQTIEKVVPSYLPGKTQTVIVKEDDLVVDSVTKVRSNIGTLYSTKDSTESITDAYSLGGGNFLVTYEFIDTNKTYSITVSFDGVIPDETVKFEAKAIGKSPLGFSIFSIVDPNDRIKNLPKMQFAKDSSGKVGQTMVVVGSETISKAILVSKVTIKDDVYVFMLNPQPTTYAEGALVADLDGNIAGIVLPKEDAGEHVVAADQIVKFIANPTIPIPKIFPESEPIPTTI